MLMIAQHIKCAGRARQPDTGEGDRDSRRSRAALHPCVCSAPSDFGLRVWMYMAICSALVAAPFLYNPLVLLPSYLLRDMRMWNKWVSRGGIDGKGDQKGKGQTWNVWWDRVTPEPSEFGFMALLGCILMSVAYIYRMRRARAASRHGRRARRRLDALRIAFPHAVAFTGLPNISRTVPLGSAAPSAGHLIWPLSLGFVCVLLPPLVLAIFDTHADTIAQPRLLAVRPYLVWGLVALALVWYTCVSIGASEFVLGPSCPYFTGGAWWHWYHSIPVAFWNAVFLYLVLAAVSYAVAALQVARAAEKPRAGLPPGGVPENVGTALAAVAPPSRSFSVFVKRHHVGRFSLRGWRTGVRSAGRALHVAAASAHARLPAVRNPHDHPLLPLRSSAAPLHAKAYPLPAVAPVLHAVRRVSLEHTCMCPAPDEPISKTLTRVGGPCRSRWPGDVAALGWCVLLFPIGLISLLLYLMLFTMIGISPVMSLDPFQCS